LALGSSSSNKKAAQSSSSKKKKENLHHNLETKERTGKKSFLGTFASGRQREKEVENKTTNHSRPQEI